MNDTGLEFSKKNLDEIVGKRYDKYSLYPGGGEYDPIHCLKEGKEPQVFAHKNGHFYKGKASYLTDDNGKDIGFIIVTNDVSELSKKQIELEKAVESANVANRHKGEFLARMSHEIRTPMNAIIGLNNIMSRDMDNLSGDEDANKLKDYSRQIGASSKHLLSLINDILDISKIEAGKIDIVEEVVDLNELADLVKTMIVPRCEPKAIEFCAEVSKKFPSVYLSDSLRLRQVLINLLGNAVKFTPENGKIVFSMKYAGQQDGKDVIDFSVKDNGIGISDEARESIFKPFEQAGTHITQKYGGTGLGLSISRRIIELLGGEIKLKSKLGEGSEFYFSLLMTPTQQEKTKNEGEINYSERFKDSRLLLVDDVDINRVIVAAMLEGTGILVDEAADGAEAVDKFKNSPQGYYDIILMDVQMPNINGYEATKLIRQMEREDAKAVPIIALTANAFQSDIDMAIESGMNSHLAKPLELATILKTLLDNL
jgi:signal transduction histidine kinase/ActR/RegA family two-component response regulator